MDLGSRSADKQTMETSELYDKQGNVVCGCEVSDKRLWLDRGMPNGKAVLLGVSHLPLKFEGFLPIGDKFQKVIKVGEFQFQFSNAPLSASELGWPPRS
jgi:hypothetical protein